MHAIIGATGHVGSAVLSNLLQADQDVLAITHSEHKKPGLEQTGAKVAVINVKEPNLLAKNLSGADTVFVLMPPGDVSKDSVKEELESVKSLIESLSMAKPKRVVVESTQGAQKGEMIGDLGVLYELEEGVRKLNLPTSVTRAGFYMSNWDVQLENAKQGKILSLFPEDFKMPMVAPQDLGRFNASQLQNKNIKAFEIIDFSGPRLYSARDVANAFSTALKRSVDVEVVPQDKWEESFKSLGFSEISAKSYSRMSKIAFDQSYENQGRPMKGETTLEDYVLNLVKGS